MRTHGSFAIGFVIMIALQTVPPVLQATGQMKNAANV
jgi:heme/copper-type cytochrome/quinol oxidase subunit 4